VSCVANWRAVYAAAARLVERVARATSWAASSSVSCRPKPRTGPCLGTGHWALGTGHWALGTGHWALGTGHWEVDLVMGVNNASAIGTLVERATRFVMLLHLGRDRSAEAVCAAMTAKIMTLPGAQFTVETGVRVYFCDPHTPWQPGSNESTNGLLRQYFPKGTSLSRHSAADLDAATAGLNGRPRMTLGWATPAEKMNQLLLH
jgi:hypothetical protein